MAAQFLLVNQRRALVGSGEGAGLNPCVREMPQPVGAEQEHAADGGNELALMLRRQSQGGEVVPPQLAHRGERLRSNCEVDRFVVERRHGFLVVGALPGAAAHLGDQRRVGLPVGRAQAHVGALLRPFALHVVGTQRAGRHPGHQHLGAAPGQDFDFGQQTRLDAVGHQVGQPLLVAQRIGQAGHAAGLFVHADHQVTAGGIGEGHQRADDGPVR
jgi:hypothetical protein